MIETLFVGIDVGKTFNTVRLLDPYGTTLKLFTVPNDKPGAEKLRDSLKDTLLHADFDSVTIGMESTSVYADHLALFLRNDEFLRLEYISLTPNKLLTLGKLTLICLKQITLILLLSRIFCVSDVFPKKLSLMKNVSLCVILQELVFKPLKI